MNLAGAAAAPFGLVPGQGSAGTPHGRRFVHQIPEIELQRAGAVKRAQGGDAFAGAGEQDGEGRGLGSGVWFQFSRSDKQHLSFIAAGRKTAKRQVLFIALWSETQTVGRRIPFNNFQPFQAGKRVLERSRVLGEEMQVQGEAGSGLEGGTVQVVAAQGKGARTVAQAAGTQGRGRAEELFGELEAEGAAEAVGGGRGKAEKPAGAKRKAAGQDIEIQTCRHEDYRTRYREMMTYGRT